MDLSAKKEEDGRKWEQRRGRKRKKERKTRKINRGEKRREIKETKKDQGQGRELRIFS